MSTPLIAATIGNHSEIVELLIDNKANINAIDSNGATALIHALSINNFNIASILINKGADINKIDNFGIAPIHIVILKNNYELFQLLVNKNVNLDVKFPDGKNLKDGALFYKSDDIYSKLNLM